MKAKYITPVVTVMDKEGNPDMEGCGKVYEHLIQGGVDGILLMGSIGEFFALTMSQKKELIRYAVHKINHRTQLIVGTTSMIVDEIIELSRFAKQEGADAVIILPPYYFPLGEKSLENYFGMLAEALSDQPIYLYNFPDRTGYDLTPEITLRLVRKYKNIVGYKDTQAGMDHTRELIKLVKGEFPEFEIYSGFETLVGSKSAVYISHRLSSCRFCDDIAVFEQGQLVQRGDHETLLAQREGLYQELWNAQAQYYEDNTEESEKYSIEPVMEG